MTWRTIITVKLCLIAALAALATANGIVWFNGGQPANLVGVFALCAMLGFYIPFVANECCDGKDQKR